MQSALVGVIVLAALAAGLGIGLYLRRNGVAGAAAAARHEADQQLAVLREQVLSREQALAEARQQLGQAAAAATTAQERIVALTAEVAKAQSEAGQVPVLRLALKEGSSVLTAAQDSAGKASVRAAECEARIAELEPQKASLRAEVEGMQEELVNLRQAASVATERLAKALADLDGAEKRRADTAAELVAAREAGTKGQAELGAVRNQGASLQAELAKARADLSASEQRFGKTAEELSLLRQTAEQVRSEVESLLEERARLSTDLDAERRAAEERKAEAEKSREQVRAEVEKITSRLLEQQGKNMLDRSREGLEALLKPLGDKLKDFEERVEKTHHTDTQERASLREQLKNLQEAQVRLHKDAEALSRALTQDSKQQGDWGEIVLERVLESAGLSQGREYELQVSHTDEEGSRRRPDALIYLPENRAVVVDAKCSLTAFVEAARATSDEGREAALREHLASVRGHVKVLAGKSYTEVLQQRSLDFVMMFVPSEAAFLAALSRDPGLYEDAFRQGVVLCSPTTLMAALRLIAQLWRTENQNQNARQIAEEAGKLLDKLAGFVADLDNVGMRLSQAQDAFASARGKLATGKGNVLRRAAAIASLGAPVKNERVRVLLAEGEPPEAFESRESGDDAPDEEIPQVGEPQLRS